MSHDNQDPWYLSLRCDSLKDKILENTLSVPMLGGKRCRAGPATLVVECQCPICGRAASRRHRHPHRCRQHRREWHPPAPRRPTTIEPRRSPATVQRPPSTPRNPQTGS